MGQCVTLVLYNYLFCLHNAVSLVSDAISIVQSSDSVFHKTPSIAHLLSAELKAIPDNSGNLGILCQPLTALFIHWKLIGRYPLKFNEYLNFCQLFFFSFVRWIIYKRKYFVHMRATNVKPTVNVLRGRFLLPLKWMQFYETALSLPSVIRVTWAI